MSSKNMAAALEWLLIELGALSDGLGKMPSHRELAQKYGCSLGTMRKAIRVLEDRGFVSSRHGHGTFLTQAGSLQGHSSRSILNKNILLLTPTHTTQRGQELPFARYKSALCRGIYKEANYMHYNLMLKTFEIDTENTERSLREFEELACSDASEALILASIWQPEIQQRMSHCGKPGIIVDHWAESGIHWDSIQPDTYGHVYEMVHLLAQMGHQKIYLFDRLENGNHLLAEAYADAMSGLALGSDMEVIHVPRKHSQLVEFYRGLCDHWSEQGAWPDAIIFHSIITAPVFFAELQQRGLRIPDDISVVGILDQGMDGCHVSGIAVDWEEIGQKTVRRLCERIQNPSARIKCIQQKSPFQYGETITGRKVTSSTL